MTNGFDDVRFPEDISFGATGGPAYNTDISISKNGQEFRNINWDQSRARYNVAQTVKSQSQLENLISFFRARKGRARGFRFKDWTDYKATDVTIGTGDDSEDSFQLIKTYTSGAVFEDRTITKPVSGTVTIYIDEVSQASGFTIDYLTGIVTFDTPPLLGEEITADFEFDVPVRFDIDHLSASLDDLGTRSWEDITLIEVR